MEQIFRIFEDKGIREVIHLGDLISPFVLDWINTIYSGKLYIVRGNNDGELLFTMEKAKKYSYMYFENSTMVELDHAKIAIMHKPVFVKELALSGVFNAVLYGHTHKAEIMQSKGTIIMNPGEACGYLTGKSSYGIINLKKGEGKIEWT